MNSEKPIIFKRSNQSTEKIQHRFQPNQQSAIEPVEQPEIEQPEQPSQLALESLAEPPRDESVYGSGWSLAQLMNEFGGRYDG